MKMKFMLLVMLALMLNPSTFAAGARDCVDCSPRFIAAEVQPDKKTMVQLKKDVQAPLQLAKKGEMVIQPRSGSEPVSSKEAYQNVFCKRLERCQDWVDVETLIEDMEASPHPESFKEFWTTPACYAEKKTNTPVPMIFNIATDVIRSQKFPKTIYEYFVEEKKDKETWLKIINTQTSDGLTFLDFLQYNINKGYYGSPATLDGAKKMIAIVCDHGGVFSKYKESAKCP